ncbi:hypothetical protein NQ314_018357 [Rhamnusium bicolor]|uniref:Rrn7/TAF1B C-terminal cyclin domain-containing protein n=1 Tax=Rhamnusium bicolor TaxID=1586634 RepID=A0AAV8WRK3_9CUCU|nr:hypothetical protein NQ314_018357 [Rhamnusium bicolor]
MGHWFRFSCENSLDLRQNNIALAHYKEPSLRFTGSSTQPQNPQIPTATAISAGNMADIECEICGGTNFYKDSGYFYCKECQTQSQEVREHEFQEEVFNIKGLITRKIKESVPDKSENELTSWECYNIVMSSLTQQLIHLGANKKFKINHKMPLDERAFIKAQCEELSKKSKQENESLHNETLTSLKSSSEKSGKADHSMSFNRYSIKELRKTVSKRHCRKHKLNKEQNLKCHKFTYHSFSETYDKGVHFVSPIKLYCILYLGLLINRDKIQLGDLFRFIEEGHLSFNNYTQLFPENYSNKFLNIQNNNKNSMFTNRVFRVTAAKMATFLDVGRYIEVVDLTQLCQRFCEEMNLPGEMFIAVKNLISKTNPKLKYSKKTKIVPNYEGRAVSFILFTLKLLFGLDGQTEFELSKYAQSINDLNINKPKMFDIIKWIEYIGYRNLIIQTYKLMKIKSLVKEMNDYKEVLMKIEQLQNDVEYLDFPSSLTPFLEYTKVLNLAKRDLSKSVLNESFQENSLDFLLRPNKYLQLLGENVTLKHGGANDNWIMHSVKSYRHVTNVTNLNHQLIPIEVLNSGCEKNTNEMLNKMHKPIKKNLDAKYVQTKYQECRQHTFVENELYVKKISNEVNLNEDGKTNENKHYNIHFNPYERYWLYLQMNIDHISKSDCKQFFNKFTNTFKLIFKECARMIEQSERELLHEFQFSELFLVFAARYCNKTVETKSNELLHDNLCYYVKQAEAHW